MTDTPQDTPSDASFVPDPRLRRSTARHRATRLLSGARPQTLRDLLAELPSGAEKAYDLDRFPDVYGDGVVRELELRTAELLGKPDAAFFPTGTMAQQVALRIWATDTGTVAMHPLSHPEVHERRAYSRLSGLKSIAPTTAPRLPTVEEIRDLEEPCDALVVELPLRDAGFVLPTWDELVAVTTEAKEQFITVHFDGARLWETTSHFGHTLPEIADLADSVYVSYYKTLGGISGAALAGDEGFIQEAKVWRHRYGGQLWQQWPAALTALAGIERELPHLDAYVAHAKVVAAALAAAPGARVNPDPPHTHQFQLWLPYEASALNEATVRLAEEQGTALFGFWGDTAVPGLAMTEVTISAAALEWTAAEVSEAMTQFLALL
ncbi:threonine aldolase family protein [Kitasatospora sp. McL0602]|uniref:threonine aldolase family protein n=1 Tax=Kitasatospora sp. McL0602 TaxID=3439530 RepID=UPI003F8BC419